MDQQWDGQLSPDLIRAAVGTGTYQRGFEYAQQGRVERLTTTSSGVLLATVRGSGHRKYEVLVTARQPRPGVPPQLSGHCTCPVSIDCKHFAAAMLVALQAMVEDAEPGIDDWEQSIADLVDDAAEHTGAAHAGVPLALQIELTAGRAHAARYGHRSRPGGDSAPLRVQLRPVMRGKTGRWIRTGVTWRDLDNNYGRGPTPVPQHREALLRMYRAFQARSGGYYAYTNQPTYLEDFGRGVWSHLRELVDLGVAVVGATQAIDPVVVSAEPAAVSLDLTRLAMPGGVVLDPIVAVGGRVLPAASVHFVGDPIHGMFCAPASRPPPGGGNGVDRPDEGTAVGLLLAPLDQSPSGQLGRLLRQGERIQIPATGIDRFLQVYYRNLCQTVTIESSDHSVSLPEVEPPRLALTVRYEPAHVLTLDWSFAYRTGDGVQHVGLAHLPDLGFARAGRDAGPDLPVVRDRHAEQAIIDELKVPDDRLPQLRTEVAGERLLTPTVRLTGLDTATFTEDLLPELEARDDILVEVLGTPSDYRYTDSAPQISISATDSSESDWFDLGITVTIDGEDIAFGPLFTALAQGASQLLLDTGTYFDIDRPELEALRTLIEQARALQDRESTGLRVSVYQAGLWDELLELGVVTAQSERWQRTVAGLLDIDSLDPPALPTQFRAELRPYQLDGYSWLSFLFDHELGGILADDMGLGKTIQALALVCRVLENRPDAPPFLVVAPTSVVSNWAHEAERFAPGVAVATVAQTRTRRGTALADHVFDAKLVITSYALFRIEEEAYAELPWSGLILDEAQFVKNHQGKTYQCARRLPAPFKLAVTGTPLENNLMELWALLSIVAPGLFPTPQRFTEVFRKPIERGDQPELLTSLRRRIRPLMRRRTKELVAAELPPKQEQVLEVTLNPRHQRIYQTHLQRERQKILGLIDDMDKNRFVIFRSLTLLRQLSLDPALIDDRYADVRSSKADALLEQLADVVSEGHRALVFSQFTGFLRTIRTRLDDEGIRYCYLDGRTRNRASRINEFKTGDAPVFLISLKAGGFGLNLTEADYCFVLDPWWNPAVEAQAVDRTHRIGQDKTVMVYRLVAADTIEEKVMELKARKLDLFNRVIDDGGQLAAPLSADDVKALLDPPEA